MNGLRGTATRITHRTVLSETWKKLASTSVELATNIIASSVKTATPAEVRLGRSLGRSSRLCAAESLVQARSIAGQA